MDDKTKLGLGIAAIAGFLLYFSRCPERIPEGEGLLSPSDGLLVGMEDETCLMWLSLFDVHCQRAPCDGTVAVVGDTVIVDGVSVALKQGQILRDMRLLIDVTTGDVVKRGDKISHIRFGSHVRLTIPEDYEFVKSLGDTVFGGQTVIAVKKA